MSTDDATVSPLPVTAPEASSPSVPVFGRQTAPVTYKRFGLEVERAADGERWVEEFEVRTDVDGGSIVHMLSQPEGSPQQAAATIAFMGQQLRDDDGVSVDWQSPVEPELDPESVDPERPEDGPQDFLRADPEEGEELGAPLYLWHDDSLMTEEELREAIAAFDPLEEGSSRRRFAYLSDTQTLRYKYEAIEELTKWLTEGVTRRPTQRPAPSGHGPRSTRRSSRGR